MDKKVLSQIFFWTCSTESLQTFKEAEKLYIILSDVLACSRALRVYVLACSRAWRVYVLTCLRDWRACVLPCFSACVLAWSRAFVFAWFVYVLTMMKCFTFLRVCVLSIGVLTFLSNYLFCLHKSRLCNWKKAVNTCKFELTGVNLKKEIADKK